MKVQCSIIVLCALFLFVGCATDDVPNTALAGENGFEFNQEAYITNFIYINTDNQIMLSSRALEGEENMTDLHFAFFETNQDILTPGVFTVGDNLQKCSAYPHATFSSEMVEGDDLLGEENAEAGFLRVVSVNEFEQRIDVIFEFTRADGKLVAGTYKGNYIVKE